MLKHSSTFEIPFTSKTRVNDIINLLKQKNIREIEHPVIMLEPDTDTLNFQALTYLYAALNNIIGSGKIQNGKPNNRRIFISHHNETPFNDIHTLIERDFSLSLQVKKIKIKAHSKTTSTESLKEKYKDLPIAWGKGKLKLDDVFGIWKDSPVTLEEIRKKAWKKR